MSVLRGVAGFEREETSGHLEGDSLCWRGAERPILSNVSIGVASNEVVGLLGRDGAGKTSLFQLLAGLDAVSSGVIRFNGLDVTAKPANERARLGLSYLPEEPSIFKGLTVEENIQLALDFSGLDGDSCSARLEELLVTFKLVRVRYQSSTSLSGGERRRCEIARSMALRPRIFMLDEPFRGLDPMSVLDVARAIATLKREGVGVLVSDYDLRDLIDLMDRAYVLHEGRVIFHGRPDQLMNDVKVRVLYLGEQFAL